MSVRNRVVALAGAGALVLASALLPSQGGLETIKKHEGVRTTAYLDAVGIPTICYGSTTRVFLGQKATLAECEVLLKEDAKYAGAAVARLVKVKLTQSQYDALVSLVFNIGPGAFAKSTLLRKLNVGDCYGASQQFDRWVFAKGKKLKGLVSRRADERAAFEKGCSVWAQ